LSIFGSNFQKKIQIERLHLEEDAAKNIHSTDKTLVDYNRGGTPLIEIVSCPDLTSPQEAKAYMQELRLLARYLGVSDADMEKGHLRCDANISLRPIGEQKYWPKTEIKNINSFRFVEKALIFEVARQKQLWLSDEPPSQQSTRGWDAQTGTTYEQRLKEESNDYRFFPEPDLPPLHISSGYLEQIRHQLVELPAEKRARFKKEFELVGADVEVLVEDYLVADYFEKVMSELQDWLNTEMIDDEDGAAKLAKNKLKLARTAFGWITTELFKLMKEAKEEIGQIKITPENMAEFITLVYLNKINSSAAQIILQEMYFSGADPEHVLEEKNLSMISGNDELSTIINQIIINNPEQANDYRTGKSSLLQYFIGLAMKETKGRADPQILARLFKAKLNIE
ncbi:MAG: Asp-tRNA(Asn)/Glu-tRNA(Gln) amidotransferase subunit GatB, partial [Candidatus Komeilibacteria bacterium CG_4_9_14_3_um_filter_37_5]